MHSENTNEFRAEYNDYSLRLISEIQFGTISLVENHNQYRCRILLLLSFRLTTTKNDADLLIYRCLLHFVIRCPYSQKTSSSMESPLPPPHTSIHPS